MRLISALSVKSGILGVAALFYFSPICSGDIGPTYYSFQTGFVSGAIDANLFAGGAPINFDYTSPFPPFAPNHLALSHTVPGGSGSSFTGSIGADPGSLHAMATATAPNPSPGNASGYATAEFSDCVLVTSDTLPQGTPVQLQVTTHLDYSLTGVLPATHPNSPSANINNAWELKPGSLNGIPGTSDTLTFSTMETYGQPQQPNDFSFVYNTSVGQLFCVAGYLYGQVAAYGGNGPETLTADASNTATFNLVPITPGASYVTGDGVTYVPEPMSDCVLGLVGIGLLSRRRRIAHQRRARPIIPA